MVERFAPKDKFNLRAKFYERRQGLNEPLLSYVESKIRLGQKLDISIDEKEMVTVIQRGLINRFDSLALAEFDTINELMTAVRKTATRHEKVFRRQENVFFVNSKPGQKSFEYQSNDKSAHAGKQKQKIFNKSSPPSQPPSSKRNVRDPNSSKRQSKCFACNQIGHFARDCKASQPRKPNFVDQLNQTKKELREYLDQKLEEIMRRIQATDPPQDLKTETKNE
ncbi:hypothetical protein B4U79_17156 [Dinothrombium tinctorium]|uniref:CCHC-type domain-containing protein n=1 Tax=Dinothrombium tinctorium TaxID=1965070 RepID=A0A3S3PVN8_9ACAR|nr:hypothetical protein B4U79_17156 [Dinothrombium tinctorium]